MFTVGAGYSMCDVSCESNVTTIKMEADIPTRNWPNHFYYVLEETTMHEAIEEKAV